MAIYLLTAHRSSGMRYNDMNGYTNAKRVKASKTQPLRRCAELARPVLNHASNVREGHHALTAL